MIGRLNHVAIAVPDLAAATKVYRDTLGAKVSSPRDRGLAVRTPGFVK
jgi:methylmalonyl-CoA/ethylmalonyl-CoA epimerase